jgi:hypothetical protein
MFQRTSVDARAVERCLLIVVRSAALGSALLRFLGRAYGSAELTPTAELAERRLRELVGTPCDVVCDCDLGAKADAGRRLLERWARAGLVSGTAALLGGSSELAHDSVAFVHLPDPLDPAALQRALRRGELLEAPASHHDVRRAS